MPFSKSRCCRGLNKNIQRQITFAFDSIIGEKKNNMVFMNWIFGNLNISTIVEKACNYEEIPKHVMDNYNDKSLMERW